MNELWAVVAQGSYLLFFLGLCSPNLDLLRKFFLSGSVLAILYSAGADRALLWVPLSWHAAFLFLSGTQIVVSGIRKRKEQLDPIEKFLKNSVFKKFSPDDLRGILRFGMEGSAPSGQVIIKAGEPVREVTCVLQGSVSVLEDQAKLMEFGSGRLLGISGYLGEAVSAFDVVASTEVKVMVWTNSSIEQWVGSNTARLALMQEALGAQLVEQILLEGVARKKLAEKGGSP